eukprot:scaffold81257_cov58-Phaeocystis_antarctica.AAC.5
MSSSHVGGGGHGVALSHSFLHCFFCFLHVFFPNPSSLHSSKASSQSSLQVPTSAELLHGGGDGDGGGDATATGAAGGGDGDDEGGGGVGDDESGVGVGDDEGGGRVGDNEGGGG